MPWSEQEDNLADVAAVPVIERPASDLKCPLRPLPEEDLIKVLALCFRLTSSEALLGRGTHEEDTPGIVEPYHGVAGAPQVRKVVSCDRLQFFYNLNINIIFEYHCH